MKKRIKFSFLLFLVCVSHFSFAQDTLRLSRKAFLAIVKEYHPLAFRYRLQNQIAAAEVLKARGNFDPVIESKNGSKTIDGVDYYKETNVGLDIPTWYGVSINGSYNNIDGQKLNNSETKGGLYQFGVTVPLAKNLIYDQRRALLDQAKYAQQMTAAEQILLTNELMRDAENAYWQWVKHYETYSLQTQAVDVNKKRLAMILKTYEYGERAAIDTTEAISQLISFELAQQEAYIQYVKASIELSLFLWKENQQPYEFDQLTLPAERLTSSDAYTNYSSLIQEVNGQSPNSHFSVIYYLQKQKILESERKLKWQSFLPKIDVTYNFLNKENYSPNLVPLFQNNYQYGIKLGLPVFLRQARADYQMAKVKVMQNKLDIDVKQLELTNKIKNYTTEVLNYRSQIDIAAQNINNYERLLKAEETKYDNGESSLFLINSRENKLIESKEKMIDLRLKFLKSYNELKLITSSFDVN